MAGNFGGLLKVLHLTEFTLAVEQVLAIFLVVVMMSTEVLHNTFTNLAIMIFIVEWLIIIIHSEFILAVSAQLRQNCLMKCD